VDCRRLASCHMVTQFTWRTRRALVYYRARCQQGDATTHTGIHKGYGQHKAAQHTNMIRTQRVQPRGSGNQASPGCGKFPPPHLLGCIHAQVCAAHCQVLTAVVVHGCTAGWLIIGLQLPAQSQQQQQQQ